MNKATNVQPFREQGHYTEFHNLALDYIMPRVSANAWKILSLILRKTKGWGKKSDAISYAQIRAGTGIKSDHTISKAVAQLLEMGCILTRAGATQFEPARYALNRDFSIPGPEPEFRPDFRPEIQANSSASTAKNAVEEPTAKIEATTAKNAVMPTVKNAVATTAKNADTKETKKEKEKGEWECSSNCAENSPAHAPENSVENSVENSAYGRGCLSPPPGGSDDTKVLAEICCVNVAHPDARDKTNWAAAVLTVRAASPDASPAERVALLREFERRWKDGGKRGSPYLGQIINQWARVMNGALHGTGNGPNNGNSSETSTGENGLAKPSRNNSREKAREFHERMEQARARRGNG